MLPKSIKTFRMCKNGARNIYDHLMRKSKHRPICKNKWANDFNLFLDFNWKLGSFKPKICIKDSGLIQFNFRIIHRILVVNKILHICKIKNSPLCLICSLESETITHIFFYCQSFSQIWLSMSDWSFDCLVKELHSMPKLLCLVF